MKNPLVWLAVGAALGYLATDKVVAYPPFKQIFTAVRGS